MADPLPGAAAAASGPPAPLRLGRIDYLNLWPIFHLLSRHLPEGEAVIHWPGHPNELNRALHEARLDVSPSSSFAYLEGAESYRLLSGVGICARRAVQSVVLLSPTPLEDLGDWLQHHPGPVLLTNASASSSALLRLLWQRVWKLPSVPWRPCPPGEGLCFQRPHLEIGNQALRLWLTPPQGWQVIDLAEAWHDWTGLPFVFAVWIVREACVATHSALLQRLHTALTAINAQLPTHLPELAPLAASLHGLSAKAVLDYWHTMYTTIGPEELAALTCFGAYATELGLLNGMPALRWFPAP